MRLRSYHFRRSASRQNLATTVIERATGDVESACEAVVRIPMLLRFRYRRQLHERRIAFDDRAHGAFEHFPGKPHFDTQKLDDGMGTRALDKRLITMRPKFRICRDDGLLPVLLRCLRREPLAQQ